MALRYYQQAAVDATYAHLRVTQTNPCIVLPTAAGKTHVIAQICRDAVLKWGGRVLVLAHVKELLQQAIEKLRAADPELAPKVGLYSAGLNSRDTEHPIIVAGIQSVYRRAAELGLFNLIIIDECHLIPPDGEGMYRSLLSDMLIINPKARLIGLTATPYRMSSGQICAPENLLNEVCYEVGVRELIAGQFICSLKSKNGRAKADLTNVHIRGGEYIAGELESTMDADALVEAACAEIVERTADRNRTLIFASGVAHGIHIQKTLKENHNIECGFVCGETSDGERAETLDRFKQEVVGGLFGEPLKYLCNVNVLTTGFDAPNIDCVALVRPTLSPGLYYQMVGRGFRISPTKKDCLVLDFGGNIMRHGPVDMIEIKQPGEPTDGEAPAKECQQCASVIHAAYSICPDCGFEFPARETKHKARASDASVLADDREAEWMPVRDVYYCVHSKKGNPDAPKSMRVEYEIDFRTTFSEWICLEHSGFPRAKAEVWWCDRIGDRIGEFGIPDSAEDAVLIANNGDSPLRVPTSIQVKVRRTDSEFDRIVACRYEEPAPPTNIEPPEVRTHLKADFREPQFNERYFSDEYIEMEMAKNGQ